MTTPRHREIIYRHGTGKRSGTTEDNYRRARISMAKSKGIELLPCPKCGKMYKPGSGKPHRLPRPNNFMNCEFIPGRAE